VHEKTIYLEKGGVQINLVSVELSLHVCIPLRPRLVREVKLLCPLSRYIRSIECRLFTKKITRINRKLRDESIKSNKSVNRDWLL
jgi:hypothetical protein